MNKQVVQIENCTFDQLVEAVGGLANGQFISINDVPLVELNQHQAATFLGVSTGTVIRFMERGEINNIGKGAHLRFSLPQLFLLRPEVENLKFKRELV